LNLQVARIDAERGLVFIRGAVPGAEGSYVKIRDAVKRAPTGVPMPGAFKKPGAVSAPAAVEAEAPEAQEGAE
jgi:large subunit ribosomal protein L3